MTPEVAQLRPFAADKDLVPEARGLEAVATGYHLLYDDDHAKLVAESRVYDALYAYCQQLVAKG